MIEGEVSAEHSPSDYSRILTCRHRILARVRMFFDSRGYIEVDTPMRVRCPGIDTYIDALPAGQGYYLATSPELHMKRLLSGGLDRIYQITHAFRAEEEGRLHSSEFTMLEWYRVGTDYLGILDETEDLLRCVCACDAATLRLDFPLPRRRIADVYREHAGWDPCCEWDEDRYYNDWVAIIEPVLQDIPVVCLFDFPAPLAALSRLRTGCAQECERFELFIGGVEIANAFSELTGYADNVKRFDEAARRRAALQKEVYPADVEFLSAVHSGMPECGGIALGCDRLVMALLGLNDIKRVQTYPSVRL